MYARLTSRYFFCFGSLKAGGGPKRRSNIVPIAGLSHSAFLSHPSVARDRFPATLSAGYNVLCVFWMVSMKILPSELCSEYDRLGVSSDVDLILVIVVMKVHSYRDVYNIGLYYSII